VRGRREQRNSYVPPPVQRDIPEVLQEIPAAVPVAAAPLASPLTQTVSGDRAIPATEPLNRGTVSPALPSSPGGFSPGAVAASTFSLLAKLYDPLSSAQIWQVTANPFALGDHWQVLVASFTVTQN
jgi:hypothetical protein